jgi:hypothetical protein
MLDVGDETGVGDFVGVAGGTVSVAAEVGAGVGEIAAVLWQALSRNTLDRTETAKKWMLNFKPG